MKLVVLAGGFGTRLRSEVKDVPKSLAPVCGHPFLKYLLHNWIKQGVREFVFSLYFESDKIIDYILSEKKILLKDCNIDFVIENEPLGTGGAILNVVNELKLNENFLVANSDTWLSSGIQELTESKYNTIGLVEVDNMARYGSVIFDSENRIIDFNEKSENNTKGFVNAGLYKLDPLIFEHINTHRFSFEKDFLPDFIKKYTMKIVQIRSEFIDIGIPEDYKKFCSLFERRSL